MSEDLFNNPLTFLFKSQTLSALCWYMLLIRGKMCHFQYTEDLIILEAKKALGLLGSYYTF